MEKFEDDTAKKRLKNMEKLRRDDWNLPDEDEDQFDDSSLNPQNEEAKRKNPSSNMTVRGAKRVWFAPRGSGRPSREISQKLLEAKRVLESAGEPLKRTLVRKSNKVEGPRRPRGRPKKETTITKEKRARGRPRKNPLAIEKPKRPRGRPRKHNFDAQDTDKPQRPRGRPRKNPLPEEDSRKKKT